MNERHRVIALVSVLGLAVACGGGSGSTGLIDAEGVLIDHVRQTGTCAESKAGTAFCATNSPNATAPGGQRARVVAGTPSPQATPTAIASVGATPTPVATGGESSPTPTGAPSAAPTPTASPSPEPRTVQVVVEGFGPDAACAVAARAAGSDGAWRTGPLATVDEGTDPITFTIPPDVAEPSELVLLCFAPARALPAEIATLTETDPTVVFVLPDDAI